MIEFFHSAARHKIVSNLYRRENIGQPKPNQRHKRKALTLAALSGLEGLRETVGLAVRAETVSTGTQKCQKIKSTS